MPHTKANPQCIENSTWQEFSFWKAPLTDKSYAPTDPDTTSLQPRLAILVPVVFLHTISE